MTQVQQASLAQRVFKFFTSEVPNTTSTYLLSAGIGLISADSLGQQVMYSFLQKFFNLKNPAPNEHSGVYILGLTLSIFGLIGVSIKALKTIPRVPLNFVTHSTFKPIQTAVIRKKIRSANAYWIIPTHLKQHKFDLNKPADREKALESTRKHLSRIYTWADIHYCGIAHIPLVAFLGQNLRNHNVTFYEIDHSTREAMELLEVPNSPLIGFQTQRLITGNEDVALKISVSHPIDEQLVKAKLGPTHCSVNMTLSNPQLGVLKDLSTLNMLSEQILKEIVFIHRQIQIKRLHIFYAGPTSLAFKIGQIINLNNAPEVIIHNYTRDRGYTWGLSLSEGGKLV